MNIERLVAMANDIAAFFDAEPDKAVAAEGVRFHIARFWDPRMRREIIAHVQAGAEGMSATAVTAIKALSPPPNSSNQ
ncbi:MAG: formate dehydrogenase subunit delta [Pseudomonadota bacterium]